MIAPATAAEIVSQFRFAITLDAEPNFEVAASLGIESPAHLEVLVEAVKSGDLTDEDLIAAVGDPATLNAKLASAPSLSGRPGTLPIFQ